MAFAYFIGEEALKQSSLLNDNIDMKLLKPIIRKEQEMKIRPILGTDLYNQSITQIDATSVSALNQTLLNDYVQPCLTKYVMADCLPYLSYQFRNKGVMQRSSDNSVPVDLRTIQHLVDKLTNDAEYYAERITKYLCANSTDYPLFESGNNDEDDIQPNKSNYNTGMVL